MFLGHVDSRPWLLMEVSFHCPSSNPKSLLNISIIGANDSNISGDSVELARTTSTEGKTSHAYPIVIGTHPFTTVSLQSI